MKILVLGSKGFIGSHAVSFLRQMRYDVTGCDLVEEGNTDYPYKKISVTSSDFSEFFSSGGFDICINASGSGNVSFSVAYPLSDFDYNSHSVVMILDCLRKYNPKCKYLHISSAAVYGNPKSLPISELDDLAPLSPYGYHKLISEILCKEFAVLYKIPVAILRPFSVYGPGLQKQLFWDICLKLQRSDNISLFGSGNESRDFIHINDLARLILKIIETNSFSSQIFNGASGIETPIRRVATLFQDSFSLQKVIVFSDTGRVGDPSNWRADISKSASIGFVPQLSLETGIIEYIDWFKKNFSTAT